MKVYSCFIYLDGNCCTARQGNLCGRFVDMTKHLIISPNIDEKWVSKSNENLPMPNIRADIQRGRGPAPAHGVYSLTN
jgi:hypothetical protein